MSLATRTSDTKRRFSRTVCISRKVRSIEHRIASGATSRLVRIAFGEKSHFRDDLKVSSNLLAVAKMIASR
jgi:hypothetical protein